MSLGYGKQAWTFMYRGAKPQYTIHQDRPQEYYVLKVIHEGSNCP